MSCALLAIFPARDAVKLLREDMSGNVRTVRAEVRGLKFEVQATDGWGMPTTEVLDSPRAVALKLAEFEYYGCFTEVIVRRVSDYQIVELSYFTFH